MDGGLEADAFVTINLPKAHRAPRPESFYLTHWTRTAEAGVLGPRTLKFADFKSAYRLDVSS